MCNKDVDSSPSVIKFILECCKTQEVLNKIVYFCLFIYDSVPDWFKTREMCDKVVFKYPFMLKYCLDRYNTQKMCHIAVDACLSAIKFVSDLLD